MKRRYYDISQTIRPGMTVYPGDVPVRQDTLKSIAAGDSYNLSQVYFGNHTGTHVDAPRHFIEGGSGVEALPPDALIGKARLFQFTAAWRIDRSILQGLDLKGVKRLLFGGQNPEPLENGVFHPHHVFLAEDAARYLVELGMRLVGVNAPSVDDFSRNDYPAHHILLGAGVIIIEGLDLAGVPAGDYELLCLPLKIENAEGAPARVFLRELKDEGKTGQSSSSDTY
jgi:arylformamidase